MTNVSYVPVPASSAVLSPGGRLTLVSATPVMTADETAKGTIYYDTYEHNAIPINGANYTITSNELSLVLDSTNHKSGKLYDVFSIISAGAPTLVTGPAWTNSTTRSAAISLSLGVWTNTSDMAHAYNNSTDYGTVAAHTGLYLGTFYATADGQTGMAFKPAAASGGSANILGLYNSYNRIPVMSIETDSTASWTYATAAWQAMNNSAGNSISWVDGLRQSSVEATVGAYAGSLDAPYDFGAALDSVAQPVNGGQIHPGTFGVSGDAMATAVDIFPPQIGLHKIIAVEYAQSGTTTVYTSVSGTMNATYLTLSLDM